MAQWIEVTPAYGRDYKNQTEAKADWNGGKDFRDTVSGSYVTKAEAKALDLKVIIRYSNNMKVMQAPMK